MNLTPKETFECPKCCKTFNFKSKFTRHLITHDPDAKVKCKICGKFSNNPIALSYHIKNLHTDRKRPSCGTCQRVFHNSATLRRHTEAIHSTSERPRFPCGFPGCEITFLNKHSASTHVRTEHAENPVRFRCTLCEKEFKRRVQLEQHIPTHTTEKPYNCATCGKRFAHISPKNRHEVTHLEKSTRDRLQCHCCPQTFLNKRDVHRHMKIAHENLRNYPCASCAKRFTTSYSRKIHEEAIHSANKEKIYSCDECAYKSHSKVNLVMHRRRHKAANHECYFCGKKFVAFQHLVRHASRTHTLEK